MNESQDGGVNPTAEVLENEEGIKTDSNLSPEELQLQKIEENKRNISIALEQAKTEYDRIHEELKKTRVSIRNLKQSENEEPITKNEFTAEQLVNEQLEEVRKEARATAFEGFFKKYPELVKDEVLRNFIIQRYEKIKESQEIYVDLIVKDLESAYFSVRGADLVQQKMQLQQRVDDFNLGAIPTGTSGVGTVSSEPIDPKLYKASQELRHLNITPEMLPELQKLINENN